MSSRRRRYRSKPKRPQVKRPPANEEIRAPEVRLIDSDGSQLGVVSTEEARQRAQEAEMDMVVVAQKSSPPVVRIMDLGKYTYEQKKKIAKQKVKSKSGDIKGIRIGFKISDHDREIRVRQADNFLSEGHKVKVEMRLRGREKGRHNMAKEKIKDFVSQIPDASIEGELNTAPNNISAIIARTKAQ